MMNKSIEVSIVIGFRDWGLDRLLANIQMHFQHGLSDSMEVIVSDYGSTDHELIAREVEKVGGRVVFTDARGRNWNRSAALNAGVEAACGKVVITTDADILFTPKTYTAAIAAVNLCPNALHLVQCRDLPPDYGVHYFESKLGNSIALDFEELEKISTLRPRWGMGGLAAFSLGAFEHLNGYEERMEVWGKEDTDFAKRFSLLRKPVRWLSYRECAIYHIWHESSQNKARSDAEGSRILQRNQEILESDKTPVRNLSRTFKRRQVAVSVVIPTYNRTEFLFQALQSCKIQSFPNFEVIVVENGGGEGAEEVVERMADPRVHLLRTPKKGAAAARNIGIDQARGQYVVIMDDDDLMVSTRIEDHLKALNNEVHGSYGGWIDFDHSTGNIISEHHGKEHSLASMWATGKVVVHAGLMLERRIFQLFPYDEELVAGIDYGLLCELTYHGLRLSHTESFALLRRMHTTNLTVEFGDQQKKAALDAIAGLKRRLSDSEQTKLRESGRSAAALFCKNGERARLELSNFLSGECNVVQMVNASSVSLKQDVKLKKESFEPDWYAATYPDVVMSGLDPYQHFLIYGSKMGRAGTKGGCA